MNQQGHDCERSRQLESIPVFGNQLVAVHETLDLIRVRSDDESDARRIKLAAQATWVLGTGLVGALVLGETTK